MNYSRDKLWRFITPISPETTLGVTIHTTIAGKGWNLVSFKRGVKLEAKKVWKAFKGNFRIKVG